MSSSSLLDTNYYVKFTHKLLYRLINSFSVFCLVVGKPLLVGWASFIKGSNAYRAYNCCKNFTLWLFSSIPQRPTHGHYVGRTKTYVLVFGDFIDRAIGLSLHNARSISILRISSRYVPCRKREEQA